jgi:hypothetical protein
MHPGGEDGNAHRRDIAATAPAPARAEWRWRWRWRGSASAHAENQTNKMCAPFPLHHVFPIRPLQWVSARARHPAVHCEVRSLGNALRTHRPAAVAAVIHGALGHPVTVLLARPQRPSTQRLPPVCHARRAQLTPPPAARPLHPPRMRARLRSPRRVGVTPRSATPRARIPPRYLDRILHRHQAGHRPGPLPKETTVTLLCLLATTVGVGHQPGIGRLRTQSRPILLALVAVRAHAHVVLAGVTTEEPVRRARGAH